MSNSFTHPLDCSGEGPVRHNYVSSLPINRVRFWLLEELGELVIANTLGDDHEITDAIIDSLPLLYEYYFFRKHPKGSLPNKAVETLINATAKIWLTQTILLNDVILFRMHQKRRGREVPPLFDYVWMYRAVYEEMRCRFFGIKSAWHKTYHSRGHIVSQHFNSVLAKDRIKPGSKVEARNLVGIGVLDPTGEFLPMIRALLKTAEQAADEREPEITAEMDKITSQPKKAYRHRFVKPDQFSYLPILDDPEIIH